MKIFNFSEYSSLYNKFLSELRDAQIQKDSMRFRKNLERIGEISAYEISKELDHQSLTTNTPLGVSQTNVPKDNLVLATILRAGLPLHTGLLNYFDHAENCFISAYRNHSSANDFEVEIEYLASPNIQGKVVLLSDTMLASGQSMVLAYNALLKRGTPAKVHIVSVIGSQQGIDLVSENFPENTTLWIGGVDPKMTTQSYIVPGLGDAGDLAFGEKDDE
ncbi:MAG: uracil phosphoribosyltransferase [Crocinitomicaceae bacterium]|mgnify:FL=1|nr:uracil phosphoribosyltransferase [Crocinitomicaceae bacterium]